MEAVLSQETGSAIKRHRFRRLSKSVFVGYVALTFRVYVPRMTHSSPAPR